MTTKTSKLFGWAVMFLAVALCVNGCAPTVRLQFRYVDSQEPVAESEVVIRPWAAFADPLLPFKTKIATTSVDGEIELPLHWNSDSEAKAIELTESDGSFHEWYMGDNSYIKSLNRDNWVGEQGEWVGGFTDTRKYKPVEVMIVEKQDD